MGLTRLQLVYSEQACTHRHWISASTCTHPKYPEAVGSTARTARQIYIVDTIMRKKQLQFHMLIHQLFNNEVVEVATFVNMSPACSSKFTSPGLLLTLSFYLGPIHDLEQGQQAPADGCPYLHLLELAS
jgi:predicted transcriptional regulator